MKTKKILFTSMAAVSLLSVAAPITEYQANTVQAASSSKKLTKNAYIYNYKGKRTKKAKLAKGKNITVLGTKTINGKKYYKIGKNQYIRTANFKLPRTYKLVKNAYVYNSKGKRVGKKSLKTGDTVSSSTIKIIKGKKYLKVGKGQYIKLANTSLVLDTNTPTNKPTDNATNQQTPQSPSAPAAPSAGGATAPSIPSSNDSESNSANEYEKMVPKHDGLIYDSKGVHIPGHFVTKNDGYSWANFQHELVNINNESYYFFPASWADDTYAQDQYIKTSVFEKNGKDEVQTPAPSKEFDDFKNYLHTVPYDKKVTLSSPNLKLAYEVARQNASLAAYDDRSSSADFKVAKKAIDNAYAKLDGKPVDINGTENEFYNGAYQLSDKEKNDILALVKKVHPQWENISFSKNNKEISYSLNHHTEYTDTSNFVNFKKFVPASDQEFNDLNSIMQSTYKKGTDLGDRYAFSALNARNEYDNAYNNAQKLNKYNSTSEDVANAKSILAEAYANLDGKKVSIEGCIDDYNSGAYELNDKEKNDILELVNKVEGSTDAKFGKDKYIYCTLDGKQNQIWTTHFINFNTNVGPASEAEFNNLKELMSSTYKSDYELKGLYSYSSKSVKDSYSSAYYRASKVVANTQSTSLAISKAKSDLQDTYSKLDGKPVAINTSYDGYDQYKLSEEEKNNILSLVNKCEGATDAKFSKDEKTINYTIDGRLETRTTKYYISFKL